MRPKGPGWCLGHSRCDHTAPLHVLDARRANLADTSSQLTLYIDEFRSRLWLSIGIEVRPGIRKPVSAVILASCVTTCSSGDGPVGVDRLLPSPIARTKAIGTSIAFRCAQADG